jgi:hypothetical protein
MPEDLVLAEDLMRLPRPPFSYQNHVLNYNSIQAFALASKAQNDANNQIRENIIGAILNKQVPGLYYIDGDRWQLLKAAVYAYVQSIQPKPYLALKCIHQGGRKKHHDFDFVFTYADHPSETFKIELKFNATSIKKAPQYVSPAKPSTYLSASYEEYYYTHYLPRLAAQAGLPLPTKEEYLKTINSDEPACMARYKELYRQGCKKHPQFTNAPAAVEFYNSCQTWGKESIKKFLETTTLDIQKLSDYLRETQKNKIYMLYADGHFLAQHAPMDDYVIESVLKHTHNRYECSTKSGIVMKVLLRWKNYMGVAFPAFQIS